MRKTDGFTLIELVVGIVCSALVSGAIISFMLMGVRTNRSVLDANANQRNAKIIVSMVENLASEGSITELKVDGEIEIKDGLPVDNGDRSWVLYGKDGEARVDLLSYSPSDKIIYGRNNSILMENINASMLSLSNAPLGGCILGFGIQTDDGFYETSVYNRIAEIETEGIVLDKNNFAIIDSDSETTIDVEKEFESVDTSIELTIPGRKAFLETLLSQYGSAGTIISNGMTSPIPYSLWYSLADGNNGYPPGWNENTPWCACFVSWAMSQNSNHLNTVPCEAIVDNLWVKDPNSTPSASNNHPYFSSWYCNEGSNTAPAPGDLIFFDLGTTVDHKLEHVGVVLYTDGTFVYTIEGNSGNRVALRRYALNDSSIYGYAVLDWKSTP